MFLVECVSGEVGRSIDLAGRKSVCGGSDRGATSAADRSANQRVEARDRAQQRTAARADRAIGQHCVSAPISAAAQCDRGGQAENNCDRPQHNALQKASAIR